MNCTAARDLLPGLLYDDLGADEATPLREHLTGCPACRAELASLRRLRCSLDAVPAPAAAGVDLPRLYQEAEHRRRRQLRRWRWAAAVATVAAAAALLLAVGLSLEVRVEAHQLVVRWGAPPPPAPAPPTPVPEPPAVTVSAEEVQVMRDLIHALASDAESRDARQQLALARMQSRLDAIQAQSQQRWANAERNITALYFISRDKGGNP